MHRAPRLILAVLVAVLVCLAGLALPAPAGAAVHHRHFHRSAGQRIIGVAKKFVGGRYVFGAASPRVGFDCSGLTMYAYRHAHVARLPHFAQAQRFAGNMHRIRRSQARPGDLIFYLRGNYAYHVTIFAGHGHEYSASSPSLGIRYDGIHGHNLEFRTDWHH